MRQGHGGEGGENVGTVQSIIQPLGAPPASRDCKNYEKKNKLEDIFFMYVLLLLSLTVGDDISELPHRGRRCFAPGAGHAGPSTSLLHCSFGPGLRPWSWTSGTLMAFQKDVLVVLDGLGWGDTSRTG